MRRPPRALLVPVTALALLGVAGCGGGDDNGSNNADVAAGTVEVTDNKFTPKTVEVSAGDTVTWDFQGDAEHNVSGDGFKSENLKEGTFEHTFDEAGDVSYVCTLHPGMTGTVRVGP